MSNLLPPPPAAPHQVGGPDDVPGNARRFLDAVFAPLDGLWTLIYHRDQYLFFDETHWTPLGTGLLEQSVSWYFENATWLPPATNRNPNPVRVRFPVANKTLNDLMRAIKNKVIISDKIDINTWIVRQPGDADTRDLVPMANGLFDTATRQLAPHTPRLLNTYALAFGYDPAARAEVLFRYLRSSLPNLDDKSQPDLERVHFTQEMLGLVMTPDTRFQKMFCLVGVPRSGKGTLARLIKRLVGTENFGATSLSDLGSAHGLEDIATKPVVLMGDAAFVGQHGGQRAMERLLGIIGEDDTPVNPKMRKHYTAKLPCRFLLLANDLPELPDAQQALRARQLVLKFTESFEGREDDTLDNALAGELPGIFNWALDGLDRLRQRKKFVQPTVGKEDLDILTRLVSPQSTFVKEMLIVNADDPDCRDVTQDVYMTWWNWCDDQGIPKHERGSKEAFGKKLRAVSSCGHVKSGKMPRDADGKQANALIGVKLSDIARKKYCMTESAYNMAKMGWNPADTTANDQHRF
jgi:putative DNA primase/helicase